MKEILLFTILIASFFYFSNQSCTLVVAPAYYNKNKVSDCRDVQCSDEERSTNSYTHICLFVLKNKTKLCQGVSDDQYSNIGNLKKYWKEHGGLSDLDEIKCGSNYINYSLLIIMTFFVLLF